MKKNDQFFKIFFEIGIIWIVDQEIREITEITEVMGKMELGKM